VTTRFSYEIDSMWASVSSTMASEAENWVPECPAYACETSSASVLVMMGQMASVIVSLFTSCESVSGDDTMAQEPKWVRDSASVSPGSFLPPGPCAQPTWSLKTCMGHSIG